MYDFESDLIFVIFLKFHCIWMCGKWLLLFRICFLPVKRKENPSDSWIFFYSTELNLFLCNDKSNVRLPDCTRKTKNDPELWYLSFIIDQQALKLVLSVDLGCVSQKTWKSGKQNSIFWVQKICDVNFFDSANRWWGYNFQWRVYSTDRFV